MATTQAPKLTPAQQTALDNQEAMLLGYEQQMPALIQGSNAWSQGGVITAEAPSLSQSVLSAVEVQFSGTLNWNGTGTVALNACFPHSLVGQRVQVVFGSKVIDAPLHLFTVIDRANGYGRVQGDTVVQNKSANIDSMLHVVPTALVSGNNTVTFSQRIDCNGLHPSALEGMLPLYSATKPKITVQMPAAVAGADPLLSAYVLSGGAVVTVTGTITIQCYFRDWQTMSNTGKALKPDVTAVKSVNIFELPQISGLAPNGWNATSAKQPVKIARMVHYLIDGNQSNLLSAANNITGYQMLKSDASTSAFFSYDSTNGGMASYYRKVRSRWASDFPEGIVIFDALTQNQSNPSNRMGQAVLNLTQQDGFTAAKYGFSFNTVSNANFPARVQTFCVALGDGITAL